MIFKYLRDRLQGKAPKGARRSSAWRKVRKAHLEQYPTCAVCGGSKKVEVHHVLPFYLAPDMELEPQNLITLCESGKYGVRCHLLFGHVGDYRNFNLAVESDAAAWKRKLGR